MNPIRALSVLRFSGSLFLALLIHQGAGLQGKNAPSDDPLDQTAARSDEEGEAKAYTVTVYQVWGSVETSREKPPKGLRKLLPKLKKHTRKKSFRFAAKPVVQKVRVGQTFKRKLPQGYQAEWTLTTSGGKVALRQKLVNPKKRSSILLLKKCPVITELTRIRQASDVFILVVDFSARKKA